DGLAIGRQRRFDVARGLFQLIVAAKIVLARSDRVDMPFEHKGKCALLFGERWEWPAVRASGHAGRVMQRAISAREQQEKDDGYSGQDHARHHVVRAPTTLAMPRWAFA